MNKSKLNALSQIAAVAGSHYNSLMINDTRSKLSRLLSQKFAQADYAGASKDIERIVMIDVKKDGYNEILSLINDVKEGNPRSPNSLIILNEISELDNSKLIKKNLKLFHLSSKKKAQIPHSIRVLFGADPINAEDIQRHEAAIKIGCKLTDEFFIKSVRCNFNFNSYQTPVNQFQKIQSQPIPQQHAQFDAPNPYADLYSIQPPAVPQQIIYPPAQMIPQQGYRNSVPQQFYPNPPPNPPYQPPNLSYQLPNQPYQPHNPLYRPQNPPYQPNIRPGTAYY